MVCCVGICCPVLFSTLIGETVFCTLGGATFSTLSVWGIITPDFKDGLSLNVGPLLGLDVGAILLVGLAEGLKEGLELTVGPLEGISEGITLNEGWEDGSVEGLALAERCMEGV
jgi:hypothetical protein